ncbi:hypothetical protein SOVF_156130 [Spinacia oleracea]|nr:hypothetical protein SOVF_156130 [Spinacia oleracea]
MEVENHGSNCSRVIFSRDFPPEFGIPCSPFKGFSAVKRIHHYTRDFPPGCGPNSQITTNIYAEKSDRKSGFSSDSSTWRRSVTAVRSKPPLGDVTGKTMVFNASSERSSGEREKVVEMEKLQKISREREKVVEMEKFQKISREREKAVEMEKSQKIFREKEKMVELKNSRKISGEREKVVEMEKSQKNSREREKVLEMVKLFRKRCVEISLSGRGIRRIDTAACAELRKEGKISNQSTLIIGAVPGVEVGDKFHCRVELAFVGLHKHYERGIDSMEWRGGRLATCIVASERHLDKMNDPNSLTYIGEGGVVRRNQVGKPPDQELKSGNLALWTNMNEQRPVRVVRGLNLERSYNRKILYVYDGLYEVKACEKKKGPNGNMIFEFQLTRCTGQPAVPWQACRRYQF